jgi:hypothetical protein
VFVIQITARTSNGWCMLESSNEPLVQISASLTPGSTQMRESLRMRKVACRFSVLSSTWTCISMTQNAKLASFEPQRSLDILPAYHTNLTLVQDIVSTRCACLSIPTCLLISDPPSVGHTSSLLYSSVTLANFSVMSESSLSYFLLTLSSSSGNSNFMLLSPC